MKISDLISKIRAAAQGAKAVAPPPPSRLLEPLPPLPLPEGLEQALIALRRWYRLVMMTTGLFLLLGVVSGLILIQGLADWWIDLPWLARAVFLVADIFLLSLLYRSHLHRPLQKKLGLSETALLVEKKWPELNQSVITAVELAEGNARASRGSPQLVEVVLEQARERTAALDFNEVVPTRAFRRWLLCGGGAALVVLALAWAAWPASLVLVERICLLNVPLPTRTTVVSITRDMIKPIGGDVEVRARAEGVIPKHGSVTVAYEQDTVQVYPLTPLPDAPATFSFTVHNLQKPFRYRFSLNDGRGPEFTVKAKVPPALASVECTQVFPAYTKIFHPRKLPPTGLTLLAGSILKLKVVATETLASATVIQQGVSQTIPMTLNPTNQSIEADVPIPAKDLTGFSIHLVDADGLGSMNETVYPIEIVPDKPPTVKIIAPAAESETITLRAKPVIEFQASDDYGLTQLSFNYELVPPAVTGETEPVAPQEQHIPIKINAGAAGTHYHFVLNVSAQTPAWQEGWLVNYWIEAVDNNTATGPSVTRTDRQQFAIISPEAKQAEILARMKQNASDLNTLSDTQEKASHAVGEVILRK